MGSRASARYGCSPRRRCAPSVICRSATSGSCCSAIAAISRSAAAANSGSGSSRKRLDRPERIASLKFQRRQERIGLGQLDQRCRRNAGAPPHVVDAIEGLIAAGGHDPRRIAAARPLHQTHAEPDGMAVGSLDRFERAVPARSVDADRPDLDTVVAGVADDLGRRVETHRLRSSGGPHRTHRDNGISRSWRHRRSARRTRHGFPGKP